MNSPTLDELIVRIKNCTLCEPHLPLGANPVFTAHSAAQVLIIGQAPGTKVHQTGIPWNDPSGDRLRDWLQVDRNTFYNPKKFAIIPMGFCYPGKGTSGDLPPRSECAPTWHNQLLEKLPNIQLTLLIGSYAQNYYLGKHKKRTLTETVKSYEDYLPSYFPLPHPSPRNRLWLKKNPWFEEVVVPKLRQTLLDKNVYF